GVGSHNAAGLPLCLHSCEDLLLDVQLFNHSLDDEVAILDLGKVIVKVSGGDAAGKALAVQGIELAFYGILEEIIHNAVACRRNFLFLVDEIEGHDVQQHHRHANIGEVAGDATAHDPGAQHGHLLDRSCFHNC